MKSVTVNGVCYAMPRYVYRVQAGWQTRVPQHKTKLFSDSGYTIGEATANERVAAALRAAVDHRYSLLPRNASDDVACKKFGGCQLTEDATKRYPTGEPGIFWVGDGKRLLIHTRGVPSKSIPASAGIEAAREIRRKQVEEKVGRGNGRSAA